MDFLALLNSSINFILYCTMSRQFRETFFQIFVPASIQRQIRRSRVSNGQPDGQRMRLKDNGARTDFEDSQGDQIEATMAETQATQL